MSFFEGLHSYELSLIQALQTMRTPWLDQCMLSLQFFDSKLFYILLSSVIWYGYSQKCGKRFFVLFMISLAMSSNLKTIFAQPRPFVLMPELGLAHLSSYGFPSGGALAWTTLFGFLCLTIRKTWFTIFSLLSLLVVCFSRVYLGLHFPSDVLGGWIFGLVTLTLFWLLFPHVEKLLLRCSKPMQLAISLLAAFIFSGFSIQALFVTKPILLLWVGGTIGLIWGKPLPPPSSFMQRFSRTTLAIIGIVVIRLITDLTLLYSPATFLLVGLWLSLGVPCILYFKEYT